MILSFVGLFDCGLFSKLSEGKEHAEINYKRADEERVT